jgi:hypothetical protein
MKNETPLHPCPLPLKVKGTTLIGGKRISSFWFSPQAGGHQAGWQAFYFFTFVKL